MSHKKSKSIQVRLTEQEWILIKQLTNNNSSEYLRQLWLKRLNKQITIKISYQFYSHIDVTSNVLQNFEQYVGGTNHTLMDPNNISIKHYKNGNTKITWSGKIVKSLIPKLLNLNNNLDILNKNLPLQQPQIKIKYNKDSI